MKSMIFLFLLCLTSVSWGISVKFKFKVENKYPIVSAMTCSGHSCACPEDTFIDQYQMKCVKCAEGLTFDDSSRSCFDATVEKEKNVADLKLVDDETQKFLNDIKSNAPSMCDMKTAENGKFKNCTCDDVKHLTVIPNAPDLTIVVKQAFNLETQLCEKQGPLSLSVDDIDCYGPGRGSFDKVARLGNLTAKYKGGGGSFATCGYKDGEHVLTLKSDDNVLSTIDAVILTIKPQIFKGQNVESFVIDPASLNY